MPIYALGDRVPTIHPDAFIHPDAVLIGDVHVGAESSVWPGAVLRGDYGTVVVGERTSIQDGAIIHAVSEYPTTIGSDCVIGHLAHLEGCTIHDRALVGSGSVVLHEAVVTGGFGAELAALISEALFGHLLAPVLRVGAVPAPLPYAKNLESLALPGPERLRSAIGRVTSYGG